MSNQILETEYRNDPTQLRRMRLLAELEPYRHLSRQEVSELYEKNLVSDVDLRIKLNFPNFVRRFERENTNILDFGIEIPYQRKIEIITDRFREYAKEQVPDPANV
jgi:molecular chaperone GrpE (heat shock protein)